jgi:hypothetical protein
MLLGEQAAFRMVMLGIDDVGVVLSATGKPETALAYPWAAIRSLGPNQTQ